MSSLIAIVGRPNVGKSTLFNILTGSKSAIVADFSGLTRDRKYGKVKDSSLVLIDTGGISLEDSDMSEAIKKQTENAIEEADSIKNVDIVEELSLPPVKIHCSVLAEDAIKSAIQDYKNKQKR